MQKEIIMIFNGLKASSVNNSKRPYYRFTGDKKKPISTRLIPTKLFKDKEKEYNVYIQPYSLRLKEFFKGITQGVELHIRFYYKGVFKKDGTISLTGGDISNKVKQLEDVIFKFANASDALVTKLVVEKIESINDRIEIEIRKQ